MFVEKVTDAASEPLTAAEVKSHCRIDISTDDTLITNLIIAARLHTENYLQRALINQTWKTTFDYCDYPFENDYIDLGFIDVSSVSSMVVNDSSSNATTVSSSVYALSKNGRIYLKYGQVWPASELYDREYESVVITYVRGFGASGSSVPQPIKQAMLMIIAHLYENREATADPMKDTGLTLIPIGAASLLMGYKDLRSMVG